jgi:hypothetical protein
MPIYLLSREESEKKEPKIRQRERGREKKIPLS